MEQHLLPVRRAKNNYQWYWHAKRWKWNKDLWLWPTLRRMAKLKSVIVSWSMLSKSAWTRPRKIGSMNCNRYFAPIVPFKKNQLGIPLWTCLWGRRSHAHWSGTKYEQNHKRQRGKKQKGFAFWTWRNIWKAGGCLSKDEKLKIPNQGGLWQKSQSKKLPRRRLGTQTCRCLAGKLEANWKGPYTVLTVVKGGRIWVRRYGG